jgi:competence protein ComEA
MRGGRRSRARVVAVSLPVPHGGGMIDLNTASAKELDVVPQLKGHGFEIVRYREERGRFDALRQLDEVPGLAGKWDGAEAEVQIA